MHGVRHRGRRGWRRPHGALRWARLPRHRAHPLQGHEEHPERQLVSGRSKSRDFVLARRCGSTQCTVADARRRYRGRRRMLRRRFCSPVCSGMFAAESSDKRDAEPASADAAAGHEQAPVSKAPASKPPQKQASALTTYLRCCSPCQNRRRVGDGSAGTESGIYHRLFAHDAAPERLRSSSAVCLSACAC